MNTLELALRACDPACPTCSDLRKVADGPAMRAAKDCPACGSLNETSYRDLKARHKAATNALPELSTADLTEDEAAFYLIEMSGVTDAGRYARRLTVLSWIEGRRYDPSKDEDLVALVREKVAAERAAMPELPKKGGHR